MSHDLISQKYQSEGHILISCLRAYLNLFMFTGFHLHTKETIESGQDELKRFSELIKVGYYIVPKYVLIIKKCRNLSRNQHSKQTRTGIYLRCIYAHMYSMTFWRRGSHATITQRSTKIFMGPSRTYMIT